ncbi:MAG: protoheme IX farnesyltransferase [Candidatus Marinimicrobia bacterium]|jgi:protoheme IX farnesyltransferase|nr:protoheme IX farnesyltransferase [Candidatus Neomarinimicrobiota bacterium]MBT4148990.1 protoheme IX farnesyltransferase [Candidatus Neomarinimicrobiota bacterium]MBT4318411.1 protoheme IX farnesyltransferase [Candidatus Neomarinimicrobiota bacterium]MBT4785049.1 protoheme IX farnesyltransferase [Candidatus Neomarinimicrobiota bacterium]MBT5096596.1 protoheme IX farnesyltransferase [Candidatus Neomarinimicrobiota bacterium]|tara:strand:- start:13456 stop:14337 length:882 start_codon:yes stop_codon:yes gene_type:complete
MKFKKQKATSIFRVYLELSKLNILSLVLVATFLGYYIGNNGVGELSRLIYTLLGTSLTAAGSGALNHYVERNPDKYMERTKNRPLPAGLISPLHVIIYGVFMTIGGSLLLVFKINLLTGFLSLLTAFLYVIVYTPLKRITWLNTSVGSIPGAMPILGGWTAATGEIGNMAWILFGIMYLWQHPHFYAIAWMCKDDYASANFKMLPVIEKDGSRTIRQIFWHLLLMIPVSLLPVVEGSLGYFYLFGVTIISCGFFLSAIPLAKDKSRKSALLLLKTSVLYLPVLLIIIIIDLKV